MHSQFGLHLISTQGIDGWDYTALGWISSKTYRKGPKLQPYAMKFHIPVSGRINFFECQSFPIKPETHVLVRSSSMSVEEYMNAFVAAYMTKVLFAIGLLHCKNIVQIEKGGKNPNVTHRRQRSKGTKHYILDVVPARNIKRTEYEHPLKGLRREYISGADISRNTPPKNPCLESTPGHSGGKRMLLAARTSVKSRRITAFFQCSSNSSAGYSASFFRFTTNESGKVARSLYRDFASPFR